MTENIYILSEKDLNSIINAAERMSSLKERLSTIKTFKKANLLKEDDNSNRFIEEVDKQVERYSDLIEYLKESNRKLPNEEDVNATKEHNALLLEMLNKLKEKVNEADLSPYINSKG